MSCYPGAEHDAAAIKRMQTDFPAGVLDDVIASTEERQLRQQAVWDKANRPLPDPNSTYGRIFGAIWHDLYSDIPVLDKVDTMEAAVMRNRVSSLADAVWNVIKGELK